MAEQESKDSGGAAVAEQVLSIMEIILDESNAEPLSEDKVGGAGLCIHRHRLVASHWLTWVQLCQPGMIEPSQLVGMATIPDGDVIASKPEIHRFRGNKAAGPAHRRGLSAALASQPRMLQAQRNGARRWVSCSWHLTV